MVAKMFNNWHWRMNNSDWNRHIRIVSLIVRPCFLSFLIDWTSQYILQPLLWIIYHRRDIFRAFRRCANANVCKNCLNLRSLKPVEDAKTLRHAVPLQTYDLCVCDDVFFFREPANLYAFEQIRHANGLSKLTPGSLTFNAPLAYRFCLWFFNTVFILRLTQSGQWHFSAFSDPKLALQLMHSNSILPLEATMNAFAAFTTRFPFHPIRIPNSMKQLQWSRFHSECCHSNRSHHLHDRSREQRLSREAYPM